METGHLFGTGRLILRNNRIFKTKHEHEPIRLKELCTHVDIILGNSDEDHCFNIAKLLRKMDL